MLLYLTDSVHCYKHLSLSISSQESRFQVCKKLKKNLKKKKKTKQKKNRDKAKKEKKSKNREKFYFLL